MAAAALVVGIGLGAFAGARLLVHPEAPLTFETKTWDAEWISNARFAPDG